MTTLRACKGGENGANGEFYKGGQFLNTVEANGKTKAAARKYSKKKIEVEPYGWVVLGEETRNTIYGRIGMYGKFSKVDGVCFISDKPVVSDEAMDFAGLTLGRYQELATAFNRGERWY